MLCLEHCFIWLRDLDTKKFGAEVFEELRNGCWMRMKIIKRKVTNEEVLERIGEKRALINNILRKTPTVMVIF